MKENKNVGSILRCVDDDTILDFLHKYDGFSMSPEAILSLIGTPLGLSTLSPEDLGDKPPVTQNEIAISPNETDDDYIFPFEQRDPSNHELNHLDTNLSTVFPVRKLDFDKRPTTSATDRTLASGFRLRSPPRHYNSANDIREEIYTSLFLDSRRAYRSKNQISQVPLIIDPVQLTKGEEDEVDRNKLNFEDEIAEEELLEVREAISIMHDQLILEQILPSLQPERVLSDKQIEDLGTHKKSAIEVFQETKRDQYPVNLTVNDRFKSPILFGCNLSPNSPISKDKDDSKELLMQDSIVTSDTSLTIIPNQQDNYIKGPVAIKTKNSDDEAGKVPKSPYKSYSEQSGVWNSGVPAGVGWVMYKPKSKVTKDGRYRVGIASKLNTEDKKVPFF